MALEVITAGTCILLTYWCLSGRWARHVEDVHPSPRRLIAIPVPSTAIHFLTPLEGVCPSTALWEVDMLGSQEITFFWKLSSYPESFEFCNEEDISSVYWAKYYSWETVDRNQTCSLQDKQWAQRHPQNGSKLSWLCTLRLLWTGRGQRGLSSQLLEIRLTGVLLGLPESLWRSGRRSHDLVSDGLLWHRKTTSSEAF